MRFPRLSCVVLAVVVATAACLNGVTTYAMGLTDEFVEPPADDQVSLVASAVGALGGEVFVDTNRNGQREPQEKGAAGVQVMLRHVDGDIANQALSDESGTYFFADLTAGSYTVVVKPPSGYCLTTSAIIDVTVGTVQGPVVSATGVAPSFFAFFPILSN
jgi:hypothetical protein